MTRATMTAVAILLLAGCGTGNAAPGPGMMNGAPGSALANRYADGMRQELDVTAG